MPYQQELLLRPVNVLFGTCCLELEAKHTIIKLIFQKNPQKITFFLPSFQSLFSLAREDAPQLPADPQLIIWK